MRYNTLDRQMVEDVIRMIKQVIVPELNDYIRRHVAEKLQAEEERINQHVVNEVARMRLRETLNEDAA